MSTSVIPIVTLPTVQKGTFKRLRMIHRRVIACHLTGFSNGEIDKQLGKADGYTSQVLNDPLAKSVLEAAYKDFDMEMRALIPSAIQTMRRGMASGDTGVALKAADMALKANRYYDKRDGTEVTAEEVVERVLEATGQKGERIRYATRERRFLRSVPNWDKQEAGNE
jgi:hypothetical protein